MATIAIPGSAPRLAGMAEVVITLAWVWADIRVAVVGRRAVITEVAAVLAGAVTRAVVVVIADDRT